MANPIELLKDTRWYAPMRARWELHVATCRKLECPRLITSLETFATEILNTPEHNRDGLLAIEPIEPYQAFQQYRVYVEPIAEYKDFKLGPGRKEKNETGKAK